MKTIILFIFLIFFLFPPPARAYLDPGTGSYFIQIVIGAVLGSLYMTRTFWAKLTKKMSVFLKNLFKTKKDESQNH